MASPAALTKMTITPPADAAVRYADASGDDNPIHTDARAARDAGLPGPILHGLYTMAQIARVATAARGTGPYGLRALTVDFRAAAVPGEPIEIVARPGGGGDAALLALSASQQGRRVARAAEAHVEPVVEREQPERGDRDLFYKVRANARMPLLRAATTAGLLPFFRQIEGDCGTQPIVEGRRRLMFGSNNYLGLTSDARVLRGARDALDRYGVGLTGSRLLNGTTPLHLALEAELADWLGTEDALVLSTGYQANTAVIATLAAAGDTVACDSASHASILDAIAMSGAQIAPFRHGRIDKLAGVLRRWSGSTGGALVVAEGVYSMEGDTADVGAIAEVCRDTGARLVIDEAHAVGVLGATGAGATELYEAHDAVDVRVGTFSKSLATCGGFAAGPRDVMDFLRFEARSFIFTASNVPAAVGAALAAVRITRSEEGNERRAALAANARRMREGLMALGLEVGPPADGPHGDIQVPIVPVIIGDDPTTGRLWNALFDRGVFCNAVFYPAVPQGRQLLRTSVMASHTAQDIDRALEIFEAAVTAEAPSLADRPR